MCVKLGNGPGVGPGPQAAQNLQMPHPRHWQGGQMPRSIPVGGGVLGSAGIDWCILAGWNIEPVNVTRKLK